MARERDNSFLSRITGRNKKPEISQAEIDKMKQPIEEIKEKTTFIVNRSNQEFMDETKEDLEKIKRTIDNVTNVYKATTGDSLIEFFTRTAAEANAEQIKQQNTQLGLLGKNGKKNEDLFRKMLEKPNNAAIGDIYATERTRIEKLDDFDKIVEYIPQLRQALTVLTDNIMSPDDFTKDVFTLKYNEEDVRAFDGTRDVIIDNLEKLEKDYKFETKTKQLITNTLKYGDQFVSIVQLDKEFNKFFTESGDLLNTANAIELNESNFNLSHDELLGIQDFVGKDDKGNLYNETELRQEMIDMINNIEFSDNALSIFSEELMLESDFSLSSNDPEEIPVDEVHEKALAANKKKYKKGSLAARIANSKSLFSGVENPLVHELSAEVEKQTKEEILANKRKGYVKGSYVKVLNPRKVIKIYKNGVTYGYYLIETLDDSIARDKKKRDVALSLANTFQVKTTADIDTMASGGANGGLNNIDPKTKLILDVFMKNIATRLDKKFIEKNDEFKEIIYNLMRQDYIIKKKIKVTYLSPEEVIHFYVNLNEEDGYGRSVYDPILWTAKLYLSLMIANLMLKLTRSADHRTFYIETGLSNDIEGAVQQMIRDIKGKEVKISDLNSFDTILNNVGRFHDYYIPQIDGQKTVDIDSTPGQQVDTDDQLLEDLRKDMISGMGIPASLTF